jgi:hypothetical protein
MDIKSFMEQNKYSDNEDTETILNDWKKEKEVDALLGVTITGGVTLGDALIGDGLNDQISDELYAGFKGLMGDKINSYDDVRNILVEKIDLGDSSVLGLINKIKGQLGENAFLAEANQLGINAKLAESGSQEGWDVAIEKAGEMQFVQVKLYSDPNAVINEISKVNDKIADGSLLYNGAPIEQIDFAVPENIYDEVAVAVAEKGLNVEVIKFGMTAEEGKDIVLEGVENVDALIMGNFFEELIGTALPTTFALHGLVNAFLVYKGAKEMDSLLSDTALQSSMSTLAAGSGLAVEALIQKISFIGGLPTFLLAVSVSMATRAVISRVVNRNDYVSWMAEENEKTKEMIESYK